MLQDIMDTNGVLYATDMFASRFLKEGVLNPETGVDYRRCILAPGSIDILPGLKSESTEAASCFLLNA
jgi:hypothetical protein